MKLVRRAFSLLGAALLSTLAAAAYVIAFAFQVASLIFAALTIIMAAGDHSTPRSNRIRAALRTRVR